MKGMVSLGVERDSTLEDAYFMVKQQQEVPKHWKWELRWWLGVPETFQSHVGKPSTSRVRLKYHWLVGMMLN